MEGESFYPLTSNNGKPKTPQTFNKIQNSYCDWFYPTVICIKYITGVTLVKIGDIALMQSPTLLSELSKIY